MTNPIATQQTLEEPFRRGTITLSLKIHINDFTNLVNCPAQGVLFAIDLKGSAHRRRRNRYRRCRHSPGAFASTSVHI